MIAERTIARPRQTEDGSWLLPVQIILTEQGRFVSGFVRFETVGWARDLEHVAKLRAVLL